MNTPAFLFTMIMASVCYVMVVKLSMSGELQLASIWMVSGAVYYTGGALLTKEDK